MKEQNDASRKALIVPHACLINGNDIWEALFSILEGNVPDEMTEMVCQQLAAALVQIDALTSLENAMRAKNLSWDFHEGYQQAIDDVRNATPAPAVDAKTEQPNYEAGFRALHEPLAWMQESKQLGHYWGWNLADIANDLIDRAYPSLRASKPGPAVDAVPAGEGGQPSDDELLPHLPESIEAAKRCGVQQSDWIPSWFVPWSPRNDNQNAEGPWSDWVALANAILDADAAARAALSHGEGRK